jgi:hypothetical protein
MKTLISTLFAFLSTLFRSRVVLNERHLKRILSSYFNYYHRWRTHLSLEIDSPVLSRTT